MRKQSYVRMAPGWWAAAGVRCVLFCGMLTVVAAGPRACAEDLREELKDVAAKIVYESYRDGNWELVMIRADGSEPVNLTKTPGTDELSPHVSPDGTKVSFVVDQGEGSAMTRSVYTMNIDGTGRKLVAANARQQCWNATGTAMAYLNPDSDEFSYSDHATKGVVTYDLATDRHTPHPNGRLDQLYNLCESPDGAWFVATVHAGMGYRHAILAFEATGTKVYNLEIPGCRPDISPDGKQIAWGPSDWALCVGDLDLSGGRPRVLNVRKIVTSDKPMKVYHIDWSPDGKYVAFSRGPAKKRMGRAPEIVGILAEGWDIYVADPSQTNRLTKITSDGKSNKEPDWAP